MLISHGTGGNESCPEVVEINGLQGWDQQEPVSRRLYCCRWLPPRVYGDCSLSIVSSIAAVSSLGYDIAGPSPQPTSKPQAWTGGHVMSYFGCIIQLTWATKLARLRLGTRLHFSRLVKAWCTGSKSFWRTVLVGHHDR